MKVFTFAWVLGAATLVTGAALLRVSPSTAATAAATPSAILTPVSAEDTQDATEPAALAFGLGQSLGVMALLSGLLVRKIRRPRPVVRFAWPKPMLRG